MKTKKINILFHAINGVGFGHIQRAKNIASFFEGQDFRGELHLASSSEGKFDKGIFDSFHHLSQHISKENFRFYEEQTYKELLEVALSYNIKIIFHDTYFIKPLIKEKNFFHYYVYRITSRDHFIKSKRNFSYFSRIYIPHSKQEFESIIPREEYEEYEDKIVFLGYVSDENLQQEDITLNKKSKKILISPGYGGDQDQVKDFLEYSINLVNNFLESSKEAYEVDIYAGVHKQSLLEQLEIPTDFTIHDFSSQYKNDFIHADIFIGRGGYNTVSEIISLQKKSLLYFADRLHESQQKRIEFFTDNFPFIVKSEKKLENDIEKLLWLEQQELSDNYAYIKASGKEIVDEVLEIASRPSLCIFHSSYIQDSQTFIADEIEELSKSKYFDVHLITFNKNFKQSSLYNRKIHIEYFDYSDKIYTYEKYPYVHLYTEEEKKVYAYFLRYTLDFIKKHNIDYILGEFLGDTLFLSVIKKIAPGIRLFSCARGRDIYNIYKQAEPQQQLQLKTYIDGVFVRDEYMKKFALNEGFDEKKLHVIHSGKYIEQYSFFYNDYTSLRILIGGRFVEKKGILESLDFLEEILKRGKIKIESIQLVGEKSVVDKEYSSKVFEKISSSKHLSEVVDYRGFLWKYEFLNLLGMGVDVFVGHFQQSSDGDTDGIPNMITENMLTGNIVFSTLAGGVGDVIIDKETGFLFSGNLQKDVELFEEVFLSTREENLHKICQKARAHIEENCNIKVQTQKMREIMEGNLE